MTMTIGQAFDTLFGPDAPVAFEAFDGSTGGSGEGYRVRLLNPEGLNYLITAPGDLGLARAYLQGDLVVEGLDEGDPYDFLVLMKDRLSMTRPAVHDVKDYVTLVRRYGLKPPTLPEIETPSPVRRLAHGLRHGRRRDADAIHHHYDVSNTFYEMLLGPSMAYTCACYPTEDATLEEAQEHKFDLVCKKLGLQPGMRLLDVGCGWGGMVMHAVKNYGVTAIGVTLSGEQAEWGAAKLREEGLGDRAEIRHQDYRDVIETGFDAISSIGLTEHIGPKNYPSYFEFLASHLRERGRLLNHCITRPDNQHAGIPSRGFINRYVFPDGGLTGSGDIVRVMEDTGFEVQHQENLRMHYARTTRAWCKNLSANWDKCVLETGLQTARVWGLYLAGSSLGFERNEIQLHQVLATRTDALGDASYPLRHTFGV
ncbi:Cyclopropane-fatty-acyl-phospholipid synthase [Nostocoides japonicum T1-X7]|uniref:Cyclopropane-fatty-acyl-phospholipid synthase n=1 Tax=Nostocoides japonicum T1-X7 TaxID=1194083 RepID=A0A077M2B2_9MICO|nr:cyclopropane-fatty-acyl-phospholipid synthase family protein [Tetrasphaera japonica]CCH78370.1 Cyclopropane-fatty-acyl-phospholipid synthase [Tetrasphaera japonica T1-X7]